MKALLRIDTPCPTLRLFMPVPPLLPALLLHVLNMSRQFAHLLPIRLLLNADEEVPVTPAYPVLRLQAR